MKVKHLIPATIALIVFIFLYEWFLHGYLLAPIYESTPQLWRTRADMPHYFPFLTAAQVILGIVVTQIFAKGYENRGIAEGIRFGVLMGFLFAPNQLIWYAIQPIPSQLLIFWITGTFAETILGGVLLALICRPKTA